MPHAIATQSKGTNPRDASASVAAVAIDGSRVSYTLHSYLASTVGFVSDNAPESEIDKRRASHA